MDVRGFRLEFGDDHEVGAGLRQWVSLESGYYIFSWFAPVGNGGAAAGKVYKADGTQIAGYVPGGGTSPASLPAQTGFWNRFFKVFKLDEASRVQVGFTPSNSESLSVGAPMLERISPAGVVAGLRPGLFENTQDSKLVSSRACADSDGDTFRQDHWRRGCINVCADGYKSSCDENAVSRCYRETSFGVSQRSLVYGEPFGQAGFAEGNFNYRLDTIALNFVGTGIKNCTESESPQGCYANGSVQYSLYHQGPFFVRNHRGEDFKADLFPAKIERARGLATERYLSNPLSAADATLIEQYTRYETRGRPLDGDFVIRIWEDEGIDFDNIEDVQILLNYRYWTRFN